jgi:hypothetical protein
MCGPRARDLRGSTMMRVLPVFGGDYAKEGAHGFNLSFNSIFIYKHLYEA